MDPMALSGAFATLVGLLANFKSERSSTVLPDFISWLKEQHQDQIVNRINDDEKLTQQLEVLLAIKHEELIVKLSCLNEQIGQVAKQIDGFVPLAAYLAPSSPLSDQAQSLLMQLVVSEADYALNASAGMETIYLFVGGRKGEFKPTEVRFLNEDIDMLKFAGFIYIEIDSKGSKKLVPSRLGCEYIRRRDPSFLI